MIGMSSFSPPAVIQVIGKLKSFFIQLGVHHLVDSSCAGDFALHEAAAEFVERYKEKGTLPMLASSCPGWICYAEKTCGDFVLPYISTTKSPQQIMGTLLKKLLSQRLDVSAEDIFHVSVMPCFDKKLEASSHPVFVHNYFD